MNEAEKGCRWNGIDEAYYEPGFCPQSHGFRPERGCHTALREMYQTWVGVVWFIEGGIAQCFTSLDQSILLETLSEHIHDGRFLRLISNVSQRTNQIDVFTTEMSCLTIVWATVQGIRLRKFPL